MEEIIFVKTKKKTVYVHAVFAIAAFATSLFFIFSGTAQELFAKTICWIAASVSGLFLLILFPIIKAKSGIIIAKEGLTDCTRLNSVGPVPWKDIISIEKITVRTELLSNGKSTGKYISREYIIAKIKPESDYGKIFSSINSNMLPGGGGQDILEKFGSSAMFINTDALDCDSEKMLKTLLERKG